MKFETLDYFPAKDNRQIVFSRDENGNLTFSKRVAVKNSDGTDSYFYEKRTFTIAANDVSAFSDMLQEIKGYF